MGTRARAIKESRWKEADAKKNRANESPDPLIIGELKISGEAELSRARA